MYFMLAKMTGMAGSCIGKDLKRPEFDSTTPLNGSAQVTLPQRSFLLQLDVRVRAINGADDGEKILFDTGVKVDRSNIEQDRTRILEADVPPHEFLTAAIHELLSGITATAPGTNAVTSPAVPLDVLQHGNLRIDLGTREVSVKGTHVRLTRKEFDLLHHLASRPKQVIRREQIMADIWGDGALHTTPARAMRTIDTHVNSLRSKLGCRTVIETVRGVGFRFIGAAEGEPVASG